MNRNHPKLKPSQRPFFSCSLFRNCTHSSLSPLHEPSPSPSPPPPPTTTTPTTTTTTAPSSSSSSSSASHSFTQWRFPLQHHPPSPPKASPPTSPQIMASVISSLTKPETARSASKVLLSMLLLEPNRRTAVHAGAIAAAVEAVAFAGKDDVAVKERTLAALELMCRVEEGVKEVRENALASEAIARCAEEMKGRGRECAMGILAAMFAGEWAAEAPEMVAAAVVRALQGECSARGRRKGAALLRGLKERGGVDVGEE